MTLLLPAVTLQKHSFKTGKSYSHFQKRTLRHKTLAGSELSRQYVYAAWYEVTFKPSSWRIRNKVTKLMQCCIKNLQVCLIHSCASRLFAISLYFGLVCPVQHLRDSSKMSLDLRYFTHGTVHPEHSLRLHVKTAEKW